MGIVSWCVVFFRASDHQQFQEQDVETHSATFRSKCGDTCTNAWSPKAKQHRSSGATRVFLHEIFCCADMRNVLMQKKRHRLIQDLLDHPGIQLIEASFAYFVGMANFSEIGVTQIGLGIRPTKNTKSEWIMTHHFIGRHATNLWTWNDEENLLRNTISQGLQREVARSPLCCKKSSGSRDGVSPLKRVAKFYNKRDSWIGTTWDPWSLLGQWLNFKLFGITYNIYLAGKIKFKLLFQGPLAMSGSFTVLDLFGSSWILKSMEDLGQEVGLCPPKKNRSPDWILIETT